MPHHHSSSPAQTLSRAGQQCEGEQLATALPSSSPTADLTEGLSKVGVTALLPASAAVPQHQSIVNPAH